jgi:hypothetical protein
MCSLVTDMGAHGPWEARADDGLVGEFEREGCLGPRWTRRASLLDLDVTMEVEFLGVEDLAIANIKTSEEVFLLGFRTRRFGRFWR